eukprot:TRINITY_DN12687_c0_g1_i1.p1 TRINITY_DN12687_c0_g1~~TRINITY_DN12687_c0_g1_i1.p1  ORF type:complete len:589 (+),score=163.00 TRINITY_DN12687_c0_g1_i1:63-1829(+)
MRRVRRSRLVVGQCVLFAGAVAVLGGLCVLGGKGRPAALVGGRRHLLQTTSAPSLNASDEDSSDNGGLYPPDLFSDDAILNGGFLLYLMGILYMFIALAAVCDVYFVPALDVITETLGLGDDVAGATFMAAGGSAPELFTSVLGVFVAKSDVGFGTIVGSAIFNVLFVIGACALVTRDVAPEGLPLTWWPLARDSLFYGIDLVVLLVFFTDKKIEMYESGTMLLLYCCYVGFMSQNEVAQARIVAMVDSFQKKRRPPASAATIDVRPQPSQPATESEAAVSPLGPAAAVHAAVGGFGGRFDLNRMRRKLLAAREEMIPTRLRQAATFWFSFPQRCRSRTSRVSCESAESKLAAIVPSPPEGGEVADAAAERPSTSGADEEEDLDLWSPTPEPGASTVELIKHVVFFPINFALWATLPNCGRPEKRKYFILAFAGSIGWIAVFSYFMVWWAERVGQVLGIPSVVMGITILAAGTSVPDLITSMIVARGGSGDMAVSSSIGSNIFDATFGLPLPWFLWSLFHAGDAVEVSADALGVSIIMLFGMLMTVVASIALFRWRLNVWLGALSFVLYGVFVLFSLLINFGAIDAAF